MEEAVFQYLLNTEDFQDISVSPLSKSFFKYAVENNNIDGILQFAVRHKKSVLPTYQYIIKDLLIKKNFMKYKLAFLSYSVHVLSSKIVLYMYDFLCCSQFNKDHLLTLIFFYFKN